MPKNSPIGFFDSGVGGLSVYSRFRELLPNENTIYFGDLKNLPYGNKSQRELIGFAKNILDFFASKNVKAVVVPNTGGLRGIQPAVAIGIVAGNSDKHLLCISEVEPNKIIECRNFLQNIKIDVGMAESKYIFDIEIEFYIC